MMEPSEKEATTTNSGSGGSSGGVCYSIDMELEAETREIMCAMGGDQPSDTDWQYLFPPERLRNIGGCSTAVSSSMADKMMAAHNVAQWLAASAVRSTEGEASEPSPLAADARTSASASRRGGPSPERNAAIEECAKIAENFNTARRDADCYYRPGIATAIRALASAPARRDEMREALAKRIEGAGSIWRFGGF